MSIKRTNEGGASPPPLKRQKIGAASSSSAVSTPTAQSLLQKLQSAEVEVAILEETLQSAEDEVARLEARLQQQEAENIQRLLAMREGVLRCGQSWNGKTTDVDIIDNLDRLGLLAVHYNANVTNQFIRDIPEMLWWQKILQPFLNLEDLTILRRTNTFFQSYWESVLVQNTIRVPQGCPTVEKAMALALVFSEKKEYSGTDPLKIQLEEGIHEIVGYVDNIHHMAVHRKAVRVTCSHITFVGKGKNHTTIRGGFYVENKRNVKFEELTIINQSGQGLRLMDQRQGCGTNVDMLKCAVKECRKTGMCVGGATVTATQCEFMENGGHGVNCIGGITKASFTDCTMHHNGSNGLGASSRAVVDLHGTKTNIHSNKRHGIRAGYRAKINNHLPSEHNTTHDNVGDNRSQADGGSIANINADGTFTHVVVEEDDDYY